MVASQAETIEFVLHSFARASERPMPYPHWFVTDCLPHSTIREILELPFAAAELGGVSGKRELHNSSRHYFDEENRKAFACVSKVAAAFQSHQVTSAIELVFGAQLAGTYLRIELAQDVDGFWLEPHTDIGVKAFTFLLYLSQDAAHADLGTDIYDPDKQWVGRSPFASGAGMIFVPSTTTYHGFEARKIVGVRKSLVVNFVTDEWRAREQLAYPGEPVAALSSVTE
jgi:hypothetical protein